MSSGPSNASITVLLDGLRNFHGKVVNQSVLNNTAEVNASAKQNKGQDFKEVWRDQLRTQKTSAANERAHEKELEAKQRNRQQLEAHRADKAQNAERNFSAKREHQKTEIDRCNQNGKKESAVEHDVDKVTNAGADDSAREVTNESTANATQGEDTCDDGCVGQAEAGSDVDKKADSDLDSEAEMADAEITDSQNSESAVAQATALELNDGNMLPPEVGEPDPNAVVAQEVAQSAATGADEIVAQLDTAEAKLSESGVIPPASVSGNEVVEDKAQIYATDKAVTPMVSIDSTRVKTSALDVLDQQATAETEAEVQEKLKQSNTIAAATSNNSGTTSEALKNEFAQAEARLTGNREFFANTDTTNEDLRGNLSTRSDAGVGVSRETLQLARNLAAQIQANAKASTQTVATEATQTISAENNSAELKSTNGVQALMAQSQAANLSPTRTGAMQAAIPFNQNHSQFMNAVAERVLWMASKNIQAAEIHMDPADLGPIQVRIAVNQDHASVNFVAHHASVRDALDLNMVRLREMFENEGIDLVNVDISDRSQQEAQEQGDGHSSAFSFNGDVELNSETQVVTGAVAGGNHLVDYYA